MEYDDIRNNVDAETLPDILRTTTFLQDAEAAARLKAEREARKAAKAAEKAAKEAAKEAAKVCASIVV